MSRDQYKVYNTQ